MRERYAYGTELLSFWVSSSSFTCNLPTGLKAETYIFGGGEETKYSKPTPFTVIMFLRIHQVVELWYVKLRPDEKHRIRDIMCLWHTEHDM